ncbi:MAG TPA: hypothetical protein VE198_10825 [Actinoallomurus sp.]|nr:hypothetical protein [Actinoallomurus sp.]
MDDAGAGRQTVFRDGTVWRRPPARDKGREGAAAVDSAAGRLGYHIVLWSLKLREAHLGDPPERLVDDIVDTCEPGTILLAHDTGHHDRLVAIRVLPAMIRGLRAKGYAFVTVPDLLATAKPRAT